MHNFLKLKFWNLKKSWLYYFRYTTFIDSGLFGDVDGARLPVGGGVTTTRSACATILIIIIIILTNKKIIIKIITYTIIIDTVSAGSLKPVVLCGYLARRAPASGATDPPDHPVVAVPCPVPPGNGIKSW